VIAIIGHKSKIAEAFIDLLEPTERWVHFRTEDFPGAQTDASRYLFCCGFLAGHSLRAASPDEIDRTWIDNFVEVARAIDCIVDEDPEARICVIGSESGCSGSFDMAYAGAKAGLHLYIETKRLKTPDQQLVGIAPSIVADAGMTLRRTDFDTPEFAARAEAHPKGRYLAAEEVARMAHFLLYQDRGYTSGTVVRMHGGMNASR